MEMFALVVAWLFLGAMSVLIIYSAAVYDKPEHKDVDSFEILLGTGLSLMGGFLFPIAIIFLFNSLLLKQDVRRKFFRHGLLIPNTQRTARIATKTE